MESAACACTTAKLLRIEDPTNMDALKRESCRRLMCTLLVMDRTFSPSINMPCCLEVDKPIADPLPDNEFDGLATGSPAHGYKGNLVLEIVKLANLFMGVCLYHRQHGNESVWRTLAEQQAVWERRLPEDLVWTPANFGFHLRNRSLRKYLYMHLLHNHICQLIYFPFLQGSAITSPSPYLGGEQIRKCHYHAQQITGKSFLHDQFNL